MRRGVISGVLYDEYKKFHPSQDIQLDSPFIRESDMMHVGHLPALATHVHPYIDHSSEVDLGHTLELLSIHEIGEIIVGDVITVARSKTDDEHEIEKQAAYSLLHPDHRTWYDEYEHRASLEAKYANSIDKLSGMIVACTCDQEVDDSRMQQLGTSFRKIAKLYEPIMEWD